MQLQRGGQWFKGKSLDGTCPVGPWLISADEIDGVLVILTPQAMTDPAKVAESLSETFTEKRFPLFTSWMGGIDVERGTGILNQAGIPTYDTPEQAIRAFIHLHEYSRNLEMLQEIPARLSRTLRFERERARNIIEEGLGRVAAVLPHDLAQARDLLRLGHRERAVAEGLGGIGDAE